MKRVALDIGHGSNTFPPDKGLYKNGKGYAEHDFNSKLGIRIKQLLEAQGHTVVLAQQPNSRDVNLNTRTNLYNRQRVDLVVSLHANASVNAGVNGRCVFYWHTSNTSKKLAQAIVNEMKVKGYSVHGNGLHASRVGSWTDLHITRVNTRDNKIPAVLVEHGFMTGNKDFELVFGSKQKQYIEDMAEANARGIQKYLGLPYKETIDMSKPSNWAEKQWNWAVKQGLVTNNPKDNMTREQGITILHSYHTMNDGGQPSEWAKQSWDWAEKQGYMNGKNPKENITRQELAAVLKSFADKNNLK